MKGLKAAAIAVAVLVGLALVAAGALLLLVDPNQHRAAIEARVQRTTGLPLAITGKIRLTLYPWLALDVGQIALGSAEGFGGEPLLAAERARVGARLLPLLGGRLEVSRVALDGLTLNLVRRADGRANWEDLGGGKPAGGAAHGDKGGGPAAVSVAGLDLSHATLTLRDEAKHSLLRVRDVELHTGPLGASVPVDVAFAARIDSGEGSASTRLELRTRAMADAERGRAVLSGMTLSGERGAAGGARPVPFSVTAPEVAFDWRQGTLAPAKFELRLGELRASADLEGEQLFGARRIKGHVRLAQQSLRAVASSLGWSLPASRDPEAFTRVAFGAAISATEDAVAIEELELVLDRTTLRGSLSLSNPAALAFDLHADAIDLDRYRAPPAPTAAPEQKAPDSPLPLEFLRTLNAHGTLAVEHATTAGLALSAVKVAVTALAGRLEIKPSATAFGGTAVGDFRLDATREPATLSLTESIRGIDIGAALQAYAHSDRLSGRANGDANLSASGRTTTALVAALEGPIDVEVRNGALEGIDIAHDIEGAQALLQGQAPHAAAGPARTPFTALSAHSRLERGVLTSDPVRLETQFLKVSGKGTFRLADQAVDYQVTARLLEAPGSLASLRSVDIPVSITGTVHDYKVRPDLGGVLKGRVQQELEKHKGELRDKLNDALKNLLPH